MFEEEGPVNTEALRREGVGVFKQLKQSQSSRSPVTQGQRGPGGSVALGLQDHPANLSLRADGRPGADCTQKRTLTRFASSSQAESNLPQVEKGAHAGASLGRRNKAPQTREFKPHASSIVLMSWKLEAEISVHRVRCLERPLFLACRGPPSCDVLTRPQGGALASLPSCELAGP